MSREIDERIVAMYFDNRNFESGAQQTLKTLEQLKQSCNMEGVGKGFEAISEVSKKMKLDKITQGISKMKTAFNGVGNIIKKAFSLTPFDNMIHALNNFRNNFLNKIIGFDVAGKLASSIENALRGLTIAPISAGWKQYENTMDSIKTIMSSTGESIDVVKQKLGEMTDYANLTIYSLNDMTSNLGKFTNNGVKLDDATNAMIGLANATADAGQGAAQASMAMYNVSQAIGVGKMTTIDWKSLENANIATQKLKRTFIQAAVASGELETKVVKVKNATTGLMEEETQYWTKAAKGQKAEQVTVENFRDTLNKGWLTKEAMLKTFSIYSGQMTIDDIAAMGFSNQQAEELAKIGEEALKAAQEVRTFTKMMDALKESVQSSWATSFEFIFGDMEEGTNLWTTINEKIDDVLTKGSEARNNILMSWRGMMKDENGQVRKIEDVYNQRKQAIQWNYDHGLFNITTYEAQMAQLESTLGNTDLWVDYREIAIGTFMDLFDTIKMVAGQVKDAWEDVFGAFDSNSLKGITSRIRGIMTSIQEWLGSSDDVTSRISKLRKGLTGVFNVLKIGWNVLKTVISAGWNLIKPFLDPILNLFGMFGKAMDLTGANNLSDIIKKLSDKFKSLAKTLKELGWSGVMGKVGNWFSDIWQKMKNGIKGWLTDNGFGGVADWFRNIRTGIESGIQSVKDWWESPDNKIAGFFKGMYDTVTEWFKSGVDENGHETRSPIAQFFYRISSDVDSAYKAVVKWWNGSGIPKFFEDLWNSVTSLFQTEEKHYAMIGGERREWTTTKTMPIVQFFLDLKDTLVSTFNDVKSWGVWTDIGNFFSSVWESIAGLFQTEDKHSAMIGTERREWTTKKTMPIIAFFTDLKDGIINAFETVKGWGVWKDIGSFFSGVWESITSLFQTEEKHYAMIGGERREWTTKKTAPIVQFFLDLKDSIINTFNEVKGWGVWKDIGSFFSGVWESITSLFQTEEKHSAMIGTERREWTTTKTMPIVQFFLDLKDSIINTFETVKGWGVWKDIGSFFSGVWESITSLFQTEEKHFAMIGGERREWTTKKTAPIVQFFLDLKDSVINTFNEVKGWGVWTEIGNFFASVWESITSLFQTEDKHSAMIGTERREWTTKREMPIVSFFNSLWEDIQVVWGKISGWPGWQEIGNFLSNTWSWIIEKASGIFSGGGSTSDSSKAASASSNFFDKTWSTLFGKVTEGASSVDDGNAKAVEDKVGIIERIFTAISGFIDDVKSWASEFGMGDFLVRVIDSVVKVLDSLSIIIEHFATMTNDLVTGKSDWGSGRLWAILEIVSIVGGILTMNIFKNKSLKYLSNISEGVNGVGMQLLEIAGGIALVALAIKVLGQMNPTDLTKGAAAVAVIILGIYGLVTALTTLQQTQNVLTQTPVTAVERVLSKLVGYLGVAGVLWILLEKLPEVIKVVSEAKKYSNLNGDDIFKTLEGIVLAVGGLMLVLALANRLAPSGMKVGASLKNVAVGFLAFAAIFAGIGALGGAMVTILDKIKVIEIKDAEGKLKEAEDIKAELEPIVAIYNIMGNMIYEFVAGLFGKKTDTQKIREAANVSEIMAQIAESFDLTRVTGVLRIAQMLTTVADTAKGIDTGKLGNMAQAMKDVGEALNSFANIVFGDTGEYSEIRKAIDGGDKELSKFNLTIDLVRQISSIMDQLSNIKFKENGLGRFIEWAYEDQGANIPVFIAAINEIIDAAGGLHDGSNISFDGLQIVQKLYDSIQQEFDNPSADLKAFNATPIVDAIVAALGLGKTAIASAIHDMVQLGIDLVNTGEYKYDTGNLLGGTNILNFFDDETLGALAGVLDEDTLKGIFSEDRLASILGEVDKETDGMIDGIEGKMNTAVDNATEAWSGANIKIGGITLDENFMTNLKTQMDELQKTLDETEDYQIVVKPVLDTTGFNEDFESFKMLLSETIPVSMGAVISIGDQALPIDDTAIIAEIRAVRTDLNNASSTLQRVLYAIDNSLGSKINGVTSAVSRLKLTVNNRPTLKQIDEGLGRAASNSELTGVTGNYDYIYEP